MHNIARFFLIFSYQKYYLIIFIDNHYEDYFYFVLVQPLIIYTRTLHDVTGQLTTIPSTQPTRFHLVNSILWYFDSGHV